MLRNTICAQTVAAELKAIIRKSESEIFGIKPRKNDIFLIDSHFGGQMSQLNGLNIVRKILNLRKDEQFRVQVYSWFTKEYVYQNYPDKAGVLNSSKVQHTRFPILTLNKKP